MADFPTLTDIVPKKKNIFDSKRTAYLLAESAELATTLLWIEENDFVGRTAYPCVFKSNGATLFYSRGNNSLALRLDEAWKELTPEYLQKYFTVTQMSYEEFAKRFKEMAK